MDQIKIVIELEEYFDNGALGIQVLINDNALPEILDVERFFALKEDAGLVPLFTCGCGDFGCGGYYVNVSCTDTELILQNNYNRFKRSLESTFDYHLDWTQVRHVAQEILIYLEKVNERNPLAYIQIGHCGGNLLDRLPDYRKSSLLIA